jgi:hypothetical protein
VVCVQEVISAGETSVQDMREERRRHLERFAHNGRFFFGTVRILSPDGKEVLGQHRSFPGADAETKKQDGGTLLTMLTTILDRKTAAADKSTEPPGSRPPFFKKGFGPKKSGPKVGSTAPDFELTYLAADKTFKLSDNFGKKPTVLIFHSFT